MNLRRIWNWYCLWSTRRKEPAFIGLVIAVVLAILILLRELPEDSSTFICQSENNLRSEKLNKSGIHVISSLPERHSWFEDSGKGKSHQAQFNPNLHECVDMQLPGKTGALLICIHDPKKDLIISAHLKNKGTWEAENIEALFEAQRRFPDMVLVDLGCNLGVFTLSAARMGMEVIAVDSMLDNLKLLQRSLFVNGLTCHVTLIHNALFSKRMQMRVAFDPNNFGASRVVEILEFRRNKINPSQLVDAICLDDLVPLVKGKTVFLKMDLEGAERAVLECASQFFQQVNVKVLLTEWIHYRHNDEDSGFIKTFMETHHMVPTWGLDLDRYIDPMASNNWPDNVFWMKRS